MPRLRKNPASFGLKSCSGTALDLCAQIPSVPLLGVLPESILSFVGSLLFLCGLPPPGDAAAVTWAPHQ